MNLIIIYLLFLKAALTSFSGLASLPMVRADFVVERQLLTDRQLNTAVVAGRTGPGPYGIYLVCVGYATAGVPGAITAFLALITPAFLVLPLMYWIGKRADSPPVRRAIRGILLASAGLLLAVCVPLGRDAITGPLTLAIVVISFMILSFTRADSVWVMAGAAAASLTAKLLS